MKNPRGFPALAEVAPGPAGQGGNTDGAEVGSAWMLAEGDLQE
jgi:hypothetical protein